MNKRDFLKTGTAALAAGMLSDTMAPHALAAETNWAGNYSYKAARLLTPASQEELQQILQTSSGLKALGTRHSFNDIADCTNAQISLHKLDGMKIDVAQRTVTVGAGVRYGQLAPYLESHGYALHNLASLPHISVAGACATATHGSGGRNRNLATQAVALEFVTADGKIVHLSQKDDPNAFAAAVVGLGALGVMTSLTLALEPTYQVRQLVYQNLSFDELRHNFDTIYGSGYSVSLFTDWQNHRANQVWIKQKVESSTSNRAIPPLFFGATAAVNKLHPVSGHAAESCTDQLGIPGPWFERLPHFRMNFTPSSGAEIQSEYFVPRENAVDAILAVEQLKDQITPLLLVTELRVIEADDLAMSTCYKRSSLGIHFTWKRDMDAVLAVLPQIEQKLLPFHPRPHWAKAFTLKPQQFLPLYPRLSDFLAVVHKYDPEGHFRNAYLDRNLYSV